MAVQPAGDVEGGMGRAAPHRVYHNIPSKQTVCGCVDVNWDDSYEFTLPEGSKIGGFCGIGGHAAPDAHDGSERQTLSALNPKT